MAWVNWLEQKEIATRTRRDYSEAWTRLGAGEATTFVDVPALLGVHRRRSLGVRARVFNRDRAALLAFVHSELGEAHWLALACRRIAPLKVARERRLPFHPLTVNEAKALAAKMPPHHARTLWLLSATGMRPEEAFEEIGNRWEVEPDGIRVHGTKSAASERIVPRVGILVKPSTKRQAFYTALRAASGKTVAPYDLRRTYSQWLDLARIRSSGRVTIWGTGRRISISRISGCGCAVSISGKTLPPLSSSLVRQWRCGL